METNKTVKTDLFKIDPRNIVVVDGFNNRVDFDIDELTESIKENGVLNPITVIRFKDSDGVERYKLVDGERRYRATMKAISEGAEIQRIPALFIPKLSDEELLIQQIVRNDGKPFNEYEMGKACYRFKECFGRTVSEIAKMLGKNQGCIHYYMDHLNRDERIQELLKNNKITGAEVRRIYAAHKNKDTKEIDEPAAVQEILDAYNKVKATGKKKITSSDLSIDGKCKTVKDSKIIRAGIEMLVKYYEKYSNNYEDEFDIDFYEILDELKKGKLINEIMQNYKNNFKTAV